LDPVTKNTTVKTQTILLSNCNNWRKRWKGWCMCSNHQEYMSHEDMRTGEIISYLQIQHKTCSFQICMYAAI